MNRRAHRPVCLLFTLATLSGCVTAREPILPELRERAERDVVILVPGITGTRLRDSVTGEMVWGNFRTLFFPRDGGYRLALPIEGEDSLEPAGVILEIEWGPVRREVYGTVARLMERNGFPLGNLSSPRTDDRFFFFPYDWRRDNLDAARVLAAKLTELGRIHAETPIQTTLICQSNASTICRYLVRFGDVTLEQAEMGWTRPPEGIVFRKVILVGTASGGAIRTLREMNRGRKYVGLVGRRWLPETLFTFPSLFQDLPAYRAHPFVDGDGEMLAVSPFDPNDWSRYGWSVFDPKVARRIADEPRFGSVGERSKFLERNLDRAWRLHRLLASDSGELGKTRVYSIQALDQKTPDQALLSRLETGWRTAFTGDPGIEPGSFLELLISEPGDGHATIQSQAWWSSAELEALAREPAYVEGGHFEMITRPGVQRMLLEILAD